MKVFREAEVAAAPVYDAPQILADEHLHARGTYIQVDDADFDPMTVQAPVAVLSDTPGRINHLGRPLGADNEAVYRGLLELSADPARRPPGRGSHLTHGKSSSSTVPAI